MRTHAALTSTYQRVRAFFAANLAAAVYGAPSLSITPGGGDAAFSPGATAPAADYDVAIRFVAGGTVGTPGVTYQTSLDAGATYGPVLELGTANAIAVAPTTCGVQVVIGAGTIPTGQILSFGTEAARRAGAVLFGWREYSKQINQGPGGANRIVFLPGDGTDGGADGEFSGPLNVGPRDLILPPAVGVDAPPGLRGRHLFDWRRHATISVWGADPARPQDDAASYEAVDRLVEDLLQGLQGTIPGLYKLGAPSWAKGQLDQLYGRELLLPLQLKATVFDIPSATVAPSPVINRDPST